MIYGVSYAEAKGSTVTNNGVWSGGVQYKIRVPITAEIQFGRAFITDIVYAGLDDGEAVKHWTVCKSDLIIRGEYADKGTPVYEDELIKYAKENELDLIHVTEYANNTCGGSRYMQHWRIGGK
ncbi:MAG: hypothetical protein HFI51_02835 [Lachnospiraceae bacterium]|nr:hypothetical protein [Lachnospiraceae bacterium]